MVADLHNDYLTDKNAAQLLKKYSHEDNYIVGAIFKGKRSFCQALEITRLFFKKRTSNLFLAYEDFSYSESFSMLEKLLDFSPVYVTLTWNGENALGGGAGTKTGLSSRGRDVIKLLNERGIALDLSHLGRRSFFEALDIAENVVCSHVAFSSVRRHKRNLDDEQLKALYERRAIVGLCLYSEFLTDKAVSSEADVIAHIDHFADRFGVDTLAIGTDFYGCEDFPEGFGDYGFGLRLKKALFAAGYDEIAANKILYENALSLLYK